MKSNRKCLTPRVVITILLLLIPLSVISACGRSGAPVPPRGSIYPVKYPHSDDNQGQEEKEITVAPKSGSYIDPSVRATELESSTRILPGSNLPYSQQSGSSFMDQGSGLSTQSPLPIVVMPSQDDDSSPGQDDAQNIEKQK